MVGKELTKLLRIPVDQYNDVLALLKITHLGPVLSYLDYRGRTQACAYIVTNALEHSTLIPTPEQTDALMSLLEALIRDQPDQPDDIHVTGGGGAGDDFVEEQTLIARLVNLLKSENLDTQFKVGVGFDVCWILPCIFESFRS